MHTHSYTHFNILLLSNSLMDLLQCVYQFPYTGHVGFFLVFGYYKLNSYEHLCTSLSVDNAIFSVGYT